jgi:DNA polymerase-3 subunit alpha
LGSDQPLLVDGTVDKGDKGLKLKATRIASLESARQRAGGYLEIRVDDEVGKDGLRRLRETLERHRGSYPVWLRVLLRQSRRESTIIADEALRVNPTRALIDEIESGFGKGTAVVRNDPHGATPRPVSAARSRREMPARATS